MHPLAISDLGLKGNIALGDCVGVELTRQQNEFDPLMCLHQKKNYSQTDPKLKDKFERE